MSATWNENALIKWWSKACDAGPASIQCFASVSGSAALTAGAIDRRHKSATPLVHHNNHAMSICGKRFICVPHRPGREPVTVRRTVMANALPQRWSNVCRRWTIVEATCAGQRNCVSDSDRIRNISPPLQEHKSGWSDRSASYYPHSMCTVTASALSPLGIADSVIWHFPCSDRLALSCNGVQ